MPIPRPSEIEKESKIVKGWWSKLITNIQKNRKFSGTLLFFVLLFLLIFSLFVLFFYKGMIIWNYPDKNIDLTKINASAAFYFERQIIKLNNTYDGELTIQTQENIPTVANIYFIPLSPNQTLPRINSQDNYCDFSKQRSCALKFKVDTVFSNEGDFQICVLVRDKLNQQRRFEYCNSAIISLS